MDNIKNENKFGLSFAKPNRFIIFLALQWLKQFVVRIQQFLFQVLIAVYLIAVVVLVRRQIYQLEDEGMERIILTDKMGRTGIRKVK